MSNWIHSYQSLRNHPKTRKLSRRVGGIAPAVGHLHCLWWWSMDYARDGDLTRFTPEDIAIAAEWDGDPETFIGYLVECEFLENSDGLRIHDHYEYIGRHLDAAAADAERKRTARRPADVQRTSSGRPADGAKTADVERKIERKKERTRAGAGCGTKPPARSKSKSDPANIRDTAREVARKLKAGEPLEATP